MSRYYDPVTHRFLNADGYFQSGTNILDANMNAYCRNNPVNFVDPMGTRCWNNGTMKVNCHVGSDGFCYSCYSYDCCNPVERENSKGSGGKSVSIIGGRTSSSTNVEVPITSNFLGGTSHGVTRENSSNSSGDSILTYYYDTVNLSSSIGVETNIGKYSCQSNISLDNTGTTLSWGDNYVSQSISWDKLQLRFESGHTNGNTTEYDVFYINIVNSGAFIAAAYLFLPVLFGAGAPQLSYP